MSRNRMIHDYDLKRQVITSSVWPYYVRRIALLGALLLACALVWNNRVEIQSVFNRNTAPPVAKKKTFQQREAESLRKAERIKRG